MGCLQLILYKFVLFETLQKKYGKFTRKYFLEKKFFWDCFGPKLVFIIKD